MKCNILNVLLIFKYEMYYTQKHKIIKTQANNNKIFAFASIMWLKPSDMHLIINKVDIIKCN